MHKKVTDNEIKTALEGAILNAKEYDCKIWSIEVCKLENALGLINRLQAEVERKDKIYIDLLKTSSERADIISSLQAETERLRGSKNGDDNNE